MIAVQILAVDLLPWHATALPALAMVTLAWQSVTTLLYRRVGNGGPDGPSLRSRDSVDLAGGGS